MNMFNIPMNRYPITLHCIENGTVAFTPQGSFVPMFDQDENCTVHPDFLSVEGHTLEWGQTYEYKLMPYLKDWLIKQKLEHPF